jgi:hypothetical protein
MENKTKKRKKIAKSFNDIFMDSFDKAFNKHLKQKAK